VRQPDAAKARVQVGVFVTEVLTTRGRPSVLYVPLRPLTPERREMPKTP
jgi:hypothetical protein